MKVILPLPFCELSPNARVCWQAKSRMTKRYRKIAWAEGLSVIGRRSAPRWKTAIVQATFYLTTSHKRDRDNLIASLKAALDGLADAGIVANDRGFIPLPPLQAKDASHPRVELEIQPQPGVA